MIGSSASRILSSSRQSCRRAFSKSFHSNRSSQNPGGAFSHFLNSPVAYTNQGDDGLKASRRSAGLPRVSLDPRDPLSVLTRRCFSASTSDDPTFRERMEARRDQGHAAAKKGAHSLREMIQKYGKVFLFTYLGVYVTTLGSLFLGIETGVLDPAYVMSWVSPDSDAKSTVAVVAEFMDHYAWTRPYKSFVENNPEVANLGVAWIAVKFTEPIRFGTTVAIVPRLSRYLGYAPVEDSDEDTKSKEVEPKNEGEDSVKASEDSVKDRADSVKKEI